MSLHSFRNSAVRLCVWPEEKHRYLCERSLRFIRELHTQHHSVLFLGLFTRNMSPLNAPTDSAKSNCLYVRTREELNSYLQNLVLVFFIER
jgi:hypothetical protein